MNKWEKSLIIIVDPKDSHDRSVIMGLVPAPYRRELLALQNDPGVVDPLATICCMQQEIDALKRQMIRQNNRLSKLEKANKKGKS